MLNDFPLKVSSSSAGFVPEEDYVGSDAERHSEEAVAHKAEVPPPLPLPLLRRRLLRLRLTKLLPVTTVILGMRTDGRVVQEESWLVTSKPGGQVVQMLKSVITEAIMKSEGLLSSTFPSPFICDV